LSRKRAIPNEEGIYFITFTCHQWLPLFELTRAYDIIYKWFDHLKGKGHYILGYVIMPNHLHALIGFSNSTTSINNIIGGGKRFIAYEIISRLKLQNEVEVLSQLAEAVSIRERKRGKLHEVFQPSFDWKECRSREFMKQKIDYIHKNPCSGKWKLADDLVNYSHSSAKFYLTGNQGVYEVKNYAEMDDIDLTKRVG